MASFRLSRTADRKIETLYEYSERRFGREQAEKYYRDLLSCLDLIAGNPAIGRPFHDRRRHEHGSHVIFYRDLNTHILIIDILHKREDADKLDF